MITGDIATTSAGGRHHAAMDHPAGSSRDWPPVLWDHMHATSWL